MPTNRRKFLALAGATGATGALLGSRALAAVRPEKAKMPGVLVDATKCVGCRACETACAEQNRLDRVPSPGDRAVFEQKRDMNTHHLTVVQRHQAAGGPELFVKKQCMHCIEPGCASACPVKALEKTAAGPVVYNAERCIGCRYCMVACPFEVPRYEYENAAPYVVKCTFCASRQKEGKPPACASVCPSGALTFGNRADLLHEARTRVYQNQDKYVGHVFGEHEAGGTSWLYIADRDFAQLGFRTDMGTTPYTELTKGALGAVPIILTLWPPFLMGMYAFSQRRDEVAKAEKSQGGHHE